MIHHILHFLTAFCLCLCVFVSTRTLLYLYRTRVLIINHPPSRREVVPLSSLSSLPAALIVGVQLRARVGWNIAHGGPRGGRIVASRITMGQPTGGTIPTPSGVDGIQSSGDERPAHDDSRGLLGTCDLLPHREGDHAEVCVSRSGGGGDGTIS